MNIRKEKNTKSVTAVEEKDEKKVDAGKVVKDSKTDEKVVKVGKAPSPVVEKAVSAKAKKDDPLVLSIKKFNYKYKDTNVEVKSTEEINLYKGDFAIVRGPNGCGKSTLLKFLIRDYDISEYCEPVGDGAECYLYGVKELENVNIFADTTEKDISVIRSRIDFIDQEDHVIDRIKVLETLMLPSLIYIKEFLKKNKEEYNAKIAELEKLVDKFFDEKLISFIDKQKAKKTRYRDLSGGQKKIIHIISKIIKAELFDAKVLLMDEPLNNLDIKNKILLNNLIEHLRNDNPDVVILIITHCLVFQNINKTIKYTKGKDKNFTIKVIEDKVACQNCLVDD